MGSSATGRMTDDAPGDQRNGIHEFTGANPVSSTKSSNCLARWPKPLTPRRISGGSVFTQALTESAESS
jgi:hypothetical protein